jgi:hypothetical protein
VTPTVTAFGTATRTPSPTHSPSPTVTPSPTPTPREEAKQAEIANRLIGFRTLPPESFAENAIIEIDAATGLVRPGARIKLRRGHYAILQVKNGWMADLVWGQSLSDWGEVYPKGEKKKPTPTPGGPTPTPTAIPLPARVGLLLSNQPRGRRIASKSALRLYAEEAPRLESGNLSLSLQNLAKTDEELFSRLAKTSTSAWVRSEFRETVFTVRVVPYRDAKGNDISGLEESLAQARDITFTLNAQRWGTEGGAGFLLIAPGRKTYDYRNEPVGTDEPTSKSIVTSSKSAATPYPTIFLNLWAWNRPNWGSTLAFTFETDQQKAVFALGFSYFFSRHAQLTIGAALAPDRVLPDGQPKSGLALSDDVLSRLRDEYRPKLFLGLGWRFGSSGRSSSAAETDPAPSQ